MISGGGEEGFLAGFLGLLQSRVLLGDDPRSLPDVWRG